MQYAPTGNIPKHQPIRKIGILLLILLCLLAACGPQPDDSPPPTLIALVSMTPSITPPPSHTPTLTPSPTLTETATPIPPTHTLTPTITPSKTLTPSPTFTATPVQVSVFSAVGGYVRSGPGVEYDVIADVAANETFNSLAYAVDTDGEIWYLIELDSGIRAWISSSVAGLEAADLSQVAMAATIPATLTLAPTITLTPLPPDANALTSSEDNVNLRSGAGLDYNKLDTLPPSEPLQIVGRNADATWYQVTTSDQRQGWVKAEFIEVAVPDVESLPVSWVEPVSAAPGVMVSGSLLTSGQIQQMRSVYQHGQTLGNNPNALITLGDSVDEQGQLFKAFTSGNYDLGQYIILQHTIDAFNSSGAFAGTYLTSHVGFSFRMVLDPTWSDPSLCKSGETPLDCEYRRHKPSYAIIYLGLNDMRFDPPENFRAYMTQVIQMLTGYGVIPILTTFTIADYYEYAVQTPAYLQIMRETAASYQIPLIEFHEAAKPLPNHGTGEDGAHLSFRPDRRIAFTGDQLLYGETLRELLTLQMLDELRRYVAVN